MTHAHPERRQMPLIDRLRSTDVDVVLVAALQAANELERTRDAALEEAAKVCDGMLGEHCPSEDAAVMATDCAAAIRALKSGATDE